MNPSRNNSSVSRSSIASSSSSSHYYGIPDRDRDRDHHSFVSHHMPSPRLSIRTPSMVLHSPPTKLERSLDALLAPFGKRLRGRRLAILSSVVMLTFYLLWSRSDDVTNLERRCQVFPWSQSCIGVHSPFDLLHFERSNGYLMYPAHETRTKDSMADDSSPAAAGVGGRKGAVQPPNAVSVDTEDWVPPQPHPIHMLMDSAKRSWEKKLARQSKTLREAVEEYERRYDRRPPKGFADWWWYAKGQNFVLVDEFDNLNDNILPFLAVPASVLRERTDKMQHDKDFWIQDKTFTLQLSGAGRYVHAHGPMKDHPLRPDQMMKLISPLSKYLPDMNITFTGHDNPWIVMSGEAREHHIQQAKAGDYVNGKYLTDPVDNWAYDGWAQSCAPHSPLRLAAKFDDRLRDQAKWKPPTQRSLIQDHVIAMDVCAHPERQTLHGFTLWPGPRPGLLYPLFALTSTSMHSDLLVPPIDQFDRPTGKDPSWEDKKKDKVVWRGTTTGADLNLEPMRDYSQRPRLCRLPFREGQITLTYAPNDKPGQVGPTEEFTADAQDLASGWFDFQFLGKPEQCNDPVACAEFEREFIWSEFMSPDEQNEYKYMIDVDGNGWSGRFHRLLSTNSLVFKSTIFPEWYRDHIQPWLHYVPISTDYSDLWEVMAFFKGDENGQGAHDALAKQIAMAGKEFARTNWRMEDMRVYTYRLLLEYARVMYRDDRDPTSMDM